MTGVPQHRWRQFVDDCNNFLSTKQAERAAELGWNARHLFGSRRDRPLMHPGGAGLLWAINGGRLVELHRDWAVIDSWIDGVARLEHHRPLTDIPPHRWRQFLSDCNNFLTGGENWAGRAAELGWNAATCSAAIGPVLSRILVVPVCYGPSRAVGSSNYIEIGQSSNWLRTDRGTSLNVGVSTQGTSRCHGSGAAVGRGTCNRCDQKIRRPGLAADCRLCPAGS